jgi:hypothetical protein
LQARAIGSVSTLRLNSGTTFCAAKMCLVSVSGTKPYLVIEGSVEKMSAAPIVPSRSAVWVTAPPAGSGTKRWKTTP